MQEPQNMVERVERSLVVVELFRTDLAAMRWDAEVIDRCESMEAANDLAAIQCSLGVVENYVKSLVRTLKSKMRSENAPGK